MSYRAGYVIVAEDGDMFGGVIGVYPERPVGLPDGLKAAPVVMVEPELNADGSCSPDCRLGFDCPWAEEMESPETIEDYEKVFPGPPCPAVKGK